MNALSNLLDKIPAPIGKALWALIFTVLAFYGAKLGLPAPVNTTTTTNTVMIPDSDPGFLAATPAGVGQNFHPRVGPLARAHLTLALAERDHLSFEDAYRKVRKISRDDFENGITAAATQQKVVGQLGDGQLLQKIIDFFNSPQGQALIKILLSLLMAFADNQNSMEIPMLMGDIHTAQLCQPDAWMNIHSYHALAV